jgi:hypothetical protein
MHGMGRAAQWSSARAHDPRLFKAAVRLGRIFSCRKTLTIDRRRQVRRCATGSHPGRAYLRYYMCGGVNCRPVAHSLKCSCAESGNDAWPPMPVKELPWTAST